MEPKEPDAEGPGVVRMPTRKRQAKRPVDLSLEFGDYQTMKVEAKESRIEVNARLLAEKTRLDHDLRKDFALFVIILAIVTTTSAVCLFIALSNRYPPAVQNSAMGMLAVIVSGGVGYITGKSAKA